MTTIQDNAMIWTRETKVSNENYNKKSVILEGPCNIPTSI